MYMVGHEHPGMNRDPESPGTLCEPMRVGATVLIATKADLAIIAALNDVLGNPRGTESWQPCHASSLMMVRSWPLYQRMGFLL
jgi:hypothetical protein